MSDNKLLRLYLDIISGKIRYCANDIITVEYPGNVDIYDNYPELIASVKYTIKEWKNENMEGLENVEL
jgi:hypothetical protein